ncbi:hypothetical protein D3C74_419520 [compost metagenome]
MNRVTFEKRAQHAFLILGIEIIILHIFHLKLAIKTPSVLDINALWVGTGRDVTD